jgi:hypothetical protein
LKVTSNDQSYGTSEVGASVKTRVGIGDVLHVFTFMENDKTFPLYDLGYVVDKLGEPLRDVHEIITCFRCRRKYL